MQPRSGCILWDLRIWGDLDCFCLVGRQAQDDPRVGSNAIARRHGWKSILILLCRRCTLHTAKKLLDAVQKYFCGSNNCDDQTIREVLS